MKSREYNVGKSDYAKHKVQPWDLWKYVGNPWLCDIVKRILRTKEGTSKIEDYEKIVHIIDYLIENYTDRCSISELIDDRIKGYPISEMKNLEDYNLLPIELILLSSIAMRSNIPLVLLRLMALNAKEIIENKEQK